MIEQRPLTQGEQEQRQAAETARKLEQARTQKWPGQRPVEQTPGDKPAGG
jgi:hypothetical protein